MRVHKEATKNPKTSGRSQDVASLQKDCEQLLKHLQELIQAARKYKQNMTDLEATRIMVRKNVFASHI